MGNRLTAIIAAVVLGYVTLLFNLYHLQLSKGQYYLARADSQYAASGVLEAPRGTIYFTDADNNHLPVALDKDFPIVYAVPKVMEDEKAASKLAPLVNMPVRDLQRRLGNASSSYELLIKKGDPAIVAKIEELKIKGVYTDQGPARYYPLGPLAGQLLGFVGPAEKANDPDRGRYGVEEFYNKNLAGVRGSIDDGDVTAPSAGQDLVLTIDPTIQKEAERIINNLNKKFDAKGGSIVVQEPKTGKILALANSPQFDPNNYGKADLSDFIDPVVQQIYEPGSVFKVLTMAAGIDAGKITPSTVFHDTGALKLNGYTIHNWDMKAYGDVTMTNVIEHSLNTGAAFAERTTGEETFKKYLLKFGFNERTGVDLPGELRGDINRLLQKDARPIVFATASFGQGVAATPLQVINAISTLANGGELMRPYVNADLQPEMLEQVIRPETAAAVTKMMISAVDQAKIAHIEGYSIAGKTGTAQVPDLKNGGYAKDRVINTYTGFGPTSDPRFTILIKLNEPYGAPLAGMTVVPAFREMAQFIINYYTIPPDRLGVKTSVGPAGQFDIH